VRTEIWIGERLVPKSAALVSELMSDRLRFVESQHNLLNFSLRRLTSKLAY
jgi:hypothetical protein